MLYLVTKLLNISVFDKFSAVYYANKIISKINFVQKTIAAVFKTSVVEFKNKGVISALHDAKGLYRTLLDVFGLLRTLSDFL